MRILFPVFIFILSGCMSLTSKDKSFLTSNGLTLATESPLVRNGHITADDVHRILVDSYYAYGSFRRNCFRSSSGSERVERYDRYTDLFQGTWWMLDGRADVGDGGLYLYAVKDGILNTVMISSCLFENGDVVIGFHPIRNSIDKSVSVPTESYIFRKDDKTGLLIAQAEFDRLSRGGNRRVFIETSPRGSDILTLSSLDGEMRVVLQRLDYPSMRASIPLLTHQGHLQSMLDMVLEEEGDEAEAAGKIVRDRAVGSDKLERQEKSQRKSDFWSGLGSALYTGLQAANEVMAEQTAQSQAELDATLRAVNAQAAAERQQEAEAAAKAQADRRYQAEQQAAYNAALAQGYSQAEASRQAAAQAEAARQREAAQAQYARQQAERERRIAEQEREAQLNAQRVMQRFTESSRLATATGSAGASQEIREYQEEYQQPATAWCYQSPAGGKFKCDGPLQRMMTSEDDLHYALKLVGCEGAGAFAQPPAPGESRKYGCGFNLHGAHNRVMPESSPFP